MFGLLTRSLRRTHSRLSRVRNRTRLIDVSDVSAEAARPARISAMAMISSSSQAVVSKSYLNSSLTERSSCTRRIASASSGATVRIFIFG